MGREVKRVPFDFEWPLNKVWDGFLMPESLRENPCVECEGSGYSPRARYLKDIWYGNVPFQPSDNGSIPFTLYAPAVRRFAQQNVDRDPGYYGTGDQALRREAKRLASLFNSRWCHHLNEADVAALLKADRLWDLTRTCSRETGWVTIEPPVVPTPEQVNEWSMSGMGHDSINCGVVVSARCKREGEDDTCSTCNGHGQTEKYEGQRGEAEAWEPTQPLVGEGWQLWETVTEGSPISPVFETDDELAQWMASDEYRWGASRGLSIEQARAFVKAGWAASMVFDTEHGLCSGDAIYADQ